MPNNIHWSEEMRLCIWLCHQDFQLNGPNTGKVVNELYRNVFQAAGRSVPIPYDTIGAAYRERSKPGPGQLWANIVNGPPQGPAGAQRRAQIDQVKNKIAMVMSAQGISAGRSGGRSSGINAKPGRTNRSKCKSSLTTLVGQRLPFVHSKDLLVEGEILIFNPLGLVKKVEVYPETEDYPRLVRFTGSVDQEVMVCDGMCDDCMFQPGQGFYEYAEKRQLGEEQDEMDRV
ncbi:hypothetical protein MBLNU230_g8233t1 [Neophaeotheca triangularis]